MLSHYGMTKNGKAIQKHLEDLENEFLPRSKFELSNPKIRNWSIC